ncbi:hypothetical protein WJ0W_001278 [Paenibacillus melissococcoides]|uniref:Uncharacterized protein n=1 Tax=Paenibacillus melissococcoides TaxID=2912268 RepID=A0ABN8TZH8_9BACL|nr:hypothetical protein WJ0W_001278 [Paenibacillus melissococcoides]
MRQSRPASDSSPSRKCCEIKFSLATLIPLPKLLQNDMNLSHSHGWKAKLGSNDAFLQEWHPIAAEIA